MGEAASRKELPSSVLGRLKSWISGGRDAQKAALVSSGYELIKGKIPPELLRGWRDPAVAERQHTVFAPLLQQMYEGKPREDFVAVATAVQMTGQEAPLIIEVGCGSGWNSEVLTHLLNHPIRYIGLDYSPAMTALGKQCYPNAQFVVGDATALPFKNDACDILLSGTVLMHLLGYREAIQESRRVARGWCIFHTVPVLQLRETALLYKRAYGQPVVEVILNEGELLRLIEQAGLALRHVLDSIPYNLDAVLGERTATRTYVCEVMEQCVTST